MTVISFLIALIVLLVVLWAVRALLTAFAIGEPIATVIWVIVVIAAIYFIVTALGHGGALAL